MGDTLMAHTPKDIQDQSRTRMQGEHIEVGPVVVSTLVVNPERTWRRAPRCHLMPRSGLPPDQDGCGKAAQRQTVWAGTPRPCGPQAVERGRIAVPAHPELVYS